jgi:hypothetical protein
LSLLLVVDKAFSAVQALGQPSNIDSLAALNGVKPEERSVVILDDLSKGKRGDINVKYAEDTDEFVTFMVTEVVLSQHMSQHQLVSS